MKVSFLLGCFLFFAAFAYGQTVIQQTADGNYVETVIPRDSAYYTQGATLSAAKFTAKDGRKYQVFLSAKGKTAGKMFYVRQSAKTGKWSRRYFETTATE